MGGDTQEPVHLLVEEPEFLVGTLELDRCVQDVEVGHDHPGELLQEAFTPPRVAVFLVVEHADGAEDLA